MSTDQLTEYEESEQLIIKIFLQGIWNRALWDSLKTGSGFECYKSKFLIIHYNSQVVCVCVCVCVLTLRHIWLFVIPWTIVHYTLCPWTSPEKNIGVGSHFLLQEIFLTQGSNPGLLDCRQSLYHLSYQRSPIVKLLFCKYSKFQSFLSYILFEVYFFNL